MLIEYYETFLKGICQKKPTLQSVQKKAKRKGFDVDNLESYNKDGNYNFTADITPSKEITKELENEILEKLETLFQRKKI